jgi:predicted nucleic acid-binding Zn ribbon protein
MEGIVHAVREKTNAGSGRQKKKGVTPRPLGEALDVLAHDLGITRRLKQYSVITGWDQIVGERIARVARARRVEHGVLYVDVQSGPWRNELAMRKPEIMEKIRKTIGKNILKDIRFH